MAKKKKRTSKKTTPQFTDLTLSDTMLEALTAAGYLTPTVIQAGMIPKALDGIDIVGQAQTGTGKTAAFAIPIIEVLEHHYAKRPRALILVPTRELAVQVREEVAKVSGQPQTHLRRSLWRQADPWSDRQVASWRRHCRRNPRSRVGPHESPNAGPE